MGQYISHPYYLTKKLTAWTMTIRALIVEKGMAEGRPTSHRIHRICLLFNTSTEKQSGTSLRTVLPSPAAFLRWGPLRPGDLAFDTQTSLAGFFYLTFNGCHSLEAFVVLTTLALVAFLGLKNPKELLNKTFRKSWKVKKRWFIETVGLVIWEDSTEKKILNYPFHIILFI